MNRIYIIILALLIFFLGLFYWTIWWLVIGIIAGAIFGFYQYHISRMRKIEAEKAETELQLEEKTDQIDAIREKVNKARQQAELANKTKTTILAKISYEIRTPLNGMMGMASLLSETNLSMEQKEYAKTIRRCGENLLTVINDILIEDILDFSKMGSAKTELEQLDFDLYDCIEEVLDMFTAKAADASLELMYTISNNTPSKLNGDALRLRQVLMNLLNNAISYTHRGEIVLSIHAEKTGQTDELVLWIELRDTGIGIEEEKLKRLLQTIRYTDTMPLQGQGIEGLGLTICNQLVNLMGGQLKIESSFGKGTTVSFSIKTKPAVQLQRPEKNIVIQGNEKKTVLIVDSNPTCLSIVKNNIEDWGFVAILASSGIQAMNVLASADKPCLVITGLHMAGMDGFELAELVHVQWPAIPVIFLAPAGNEQWKKQEQLFTAIIFKPIKKHLLGKSIARILNTGKKNILADNQSSQTLRSDFAAEFPLRILIAEDDPFNQQLEVAVLNKLGYQPQIAANGKEVLELVSATHFDLILMDVQMPEMDGLEATRMIRLCLSTQPIIIAMTANAMLGDKEACMASGMDDYLCKPIELTELMRILERWADFSMPALA
ncbi:MAG TPA: response regulator [Puia sp.]|jgi:signal transduction histidine kinase/DNA-binding response OmpR family regulator|nr:response regulator [Puia sp.]